MPERLLDRLQRWDPILPRRKLSDMVEGGVLPFFQKRRRSKDQDIAIEQVSKSDWAQNAARGICQNLAGLSGDDLTKCVDTVSTNLAEGFILGGRRRR